MIRKIHKLSERVQVNYATEQGSILYATEIRMIPEITKSEEIYFPFSLLNPFSKAYSKHVSAKREQRSTNVSN